MGVSCMFASGATQGATGGRGRFYLPPEGPVARGAADCRPVPRTGKKTRGWPRPVPAASRRSKLGSSTREMGRLGEDEACRYLLSLGALLIDRNWRCHHGEVDIVARLGCVLLFCEVRTRRGDSFGTPLESITPRKAARMGRVAQAWLAHFGPHCGPIRLDVIGWLFGDNGSVQLDHIKGVQP